jgi:hypothetical protein
MIARKSLTILLLLLFGCISYGQNDSIDNIYLSIGSKTSGICFGNSNKYNGLRLNLWDKGFDSGDKVSQKINGINLSFAAISEVTNGLQIGGIVGHTKKINGLSIASIWQNSKKINGLAASFGINSDTLNGVFMGFGVAPPNRNIDNRIINGLAIGVFVGAEKVKGVSISLFNSFSKKHYGLSVSVLNKTEELHGMQIGLLNYAGNNPRILRWLPLINFHL